MVSGSSVQLDRRTADPADPADDAGARRYRVLPDAGDGFDGELLERLGEVNMGRTETLAEFLAWGVASAPANRYALLLWGPGEGWTAVSYDETTPDRLLVPEVAAALGAAQESGALPRLALVGFGISLMGELEVLHALQPHARLAAATQGALPGRGWNYGAWLEALTVDPIPGDLNLIVSVF